MIVIENNRSSNQRRSRSDKHKEVQNYLKPSIYGLNINHTPSSQMKSPTKVRNESNLKYSDKASTIPFSDCNDNIYQNHGFEPCGNSFRVNMAPTEDEANYYFSLPEEIKQEIHNYGIIHHRELGGTKYLSQWKLRVALHLRQLMANKWEAVKTTTSDSQLTLWSYHHSTEGAKWAAECIPKAIDAANLYVFVLYLFVFCQLIELSA